MPTFHARLIQADRQPLAGATVRVIAWSLAGRAKSLVEGNTDTEGTLELSFEFEAELGMLPRIGLQLRSGNSWRDLGESPIKVSRDAIEFGTLVVSDKPALLIGTRKIYAVEQAGVTMLAQAQVEAPLDSKLADEPIKLPNLGGLGGLGGEPFELPGDMEGMKKALLESLDQAKLLDAKLLQLGDQFSKIELELDKAQANLAEYEQASPLVDVVQDLGSQLGTAAKTIDQAALGMVLGGVSISLKAVSAGAGAFEFPTISKLKQVAGAEMSTIDLAFFPYRPQLGTPVSEPDKGPGMPNLLGYTELLARRKLEQLQLAVEVSHKAVGKPDVGPSPWGRVVEQSPAPGGVIEPGTRIEILIGKPIDNQGNG